MAFGHRVQPKIPRGLAIVRMECLKPAPAEQAWFRNTGVLCPLGDKIVTGAIGHRGPNELRQGLDQVPPALFAGQQLGAALFVHKHLAGGFLF